MKQLRSGINSCTSAGVKDLDESDVKRYFSLSCVILTENELMIEPVVSKPSPNKLAIPPSVVPTFDSAYDSFFDSSGALIDDLNSLASPTLLSPLSPSQPSSLPTTTAVPPITTSAAAAASTPSLSAAATVQPSTPIVTEKALSPSSIREILRQIDSVISATSKTTDKLNDIKRKVNEYQSDPTPTKKRTSSPVKRASTHPSKNKKL